MKFFWLVFEFVVFLLKSIRFKYVLYFNLFLGFDMGNLFVLVLGKLIGGDLILEILVDRLVFV